MRPEQICSGKNYNAMIDIRAVAASTGGIGGAVTASTGYIAQNVPANIRETGGGEKIRGVMVQPGIDAVVSMRYRTDINHKRQILFGTRVFEVKRVIQIPDPAQPVETQVHCHEVPTT